MSRIGQWIVEWLSERVTEPVFQQRSFEETCALLNLLALVMLADGDDSVAEQQLVEFLITYIPKSWRSMDGKPVWRVIIEQGSGMGDEPTRLEAALRAAASLTDPALQLRAYEMVEMVFQATPTPPEVYHRWHHQLADALQVPEAEREERAAKAARDYHFRIRRELAEQYPSEES